MSVLRGIVRRADTKGVSLGYKGEYLEVFP